MDQTDERIVAMKKAYADVILNTAKVSAARVLASNSNVVRFERNLMETKEEALRTILRTKGLMDAKMNETDMICLGQERRICELEDQLSQAQHTIESLKVELERVNTEMKGTSVSANTLGTETECRNTYSGDNLVDSINNASNDSHPSGDHHRFGSEEVNECHNDHYDGSPSNQPNVKVKVDNYFKSGRIISLQYSSKKQKGRPLRSLSLEKNATYCPSKNHALLDAQQESQDFHIKMEDIGETEGRPNNMEKMVLSSVCNAVKNENTEMPDESRHKADRENGDKDFDPVGNPSGASKRRLVKYTFQRKRTRRSSSDADDNVLVDVENIPKNKECVVADP